MHEVCADQPREHEWAFDEVSVGIVGQPQQKKCYERDRNLNANGVLGSSQKVLDFQGLFDPSKEQLDLPSTLVQISNLLCACGQIIGEDAQHFASLDLHMDFANQTAHRVATGSCEPLRKVSGPIAQDRGSPERPVDLRRSQKGCWS